MWCIGHLTATHKSLEQLLAEREQKQATNGARVNSLRAHFDYSPAAYRMVINEHPPQRAQAGVLFKWIAVIVLCFLLGRIALTHLATWA